MDRKYHIELLSEEIGSNFAPAALQEVIRANLGQDSLRNQLGNRPYLHFDNNAIQEGIGYISTQHRRITEAMGDAKMQRHLFGRLTHTAQDFYAHSNYVRLWAAQNDGALPDDIQAMDADLLNSKQLQSGSFYLWRDFIYYIPLLNRLARAIYVPRDSHEWMNLDNPKRGNLFDFAMIAARKRTRLEYETALENLQQTGGAKAVNHFHGLTK